jgi:hypothetical protein
MHLPHVPLAVPIAPTGYLHNRIEPGYRPNGGPKANVHTRLNQLRTDADRWRALIKTRLDLLKDFHPVSRTHAGAEVIHRRLTRKRPALREDRKRLALGVHHNQATRGSFHLVDS